jgi:2-polyprenyl-3-methyl-5-hydroxy-6-metoxy-1,4-benzoquinol methylase
LLLCINDHQFQGCARAAYDTDAQRRGNNTNKRSEWRLTARQRFSDLLKQEHEQTVLEIGAGAGLNAKYFQDQGLEVLATDLSPKMIDKCRELGLSAQVVNPYELEHLGRRLMPFTL